MMQGLKRRKFVSSFAFGGGKIKGIKIISKGIVMWIKASDNSTEAFLHISAPPSWDLQESNSQTQRRKGIKFIYICLQLSIRQWQNQDYQQGHCDVDQSVWYFCRCFSPHLSTQAPHLHLPRFQSQSFWKDTSNGVTLFIQPSLFCNHKHHFHGQILYSTSMLTEIKLDRIRKVKMIMDNGIMAKFLTGRSHSSEILIFFMS